MPIQEISSLASLPALEKVLLAGVDAIKEVRTDLPELKLLSVAQTGISDLSVLPDMPKLETLYVRDCFNVTDIAPLNRYKNLKPVSKKALELFNPKKCRSATYCCGVPFAVCVTYFLRTRKLMQV